MLKIDQTRFSGLFMSTTTLGSTRGATPCGRESSQL